jgi:hypothetical protein
VLGGRRACRSPAWRFLRWVDYLAREGAIQRHTEIDGLVSHEPFDWGIPLLGTTSLTDRQSVCTLVDQANGIGISSRPQVAVLHTHHTEFRI